MRPETYASVELELPPERRPRERFYVQAKLPTDDPEHPFGQWSLCVDPIGARGGASIVALVGFLSASAPHHALKTGGSLELYRGRTRVGVAKIALAPLASGLLEDDFLGDVKRPPRVVISDKKAA